MRNHETECAKSQRRNDPSVSDEDTRAKMKEKAEERVMNNWALIACLKESRYDGYLRYVPCIIRVLTMRRQLEETVIAKMGGDRRVIIIGNVCVAPYGK